MGARRLEVRVVPVDEAWELWLFEGERRLALAGTVAIDAATEAWRQGLDPVAQAVERLRADAERGTLALPDRAARGDPPQPDPSAWARPLSSS
ncbi:MAG: hypothetical protein KIT25_24960 [Enhydrobacter sp.]|nr:MAG: hypothetical protein KIT25_24960 [Enhydrobacter sp.]